jgi:N-acyl-D-amino-acid deacylase
LFVLAVSLTCSFFGFSNTNAQQRPVLIRGALVVDGTGAAPRRIDVRIQAGRIAGIGVLAPSTGDSIVDASGLALFPGFIDTHSHHDRGLLQHPDALGAVSQGITTIVAGQDGDSPYPLAAFFDSLSTSPTAINLASYVGHGTIRGLVMGDDYKRAATRDEVRRMDSLLQREMDAGAIGLSTGLEYDPGIYSAGDEIIELTKVAARNHGRYISHIRSEDRHFWNAVDELITIGREAGLPVQMSHAKLAMRSLWHQTDTLLGILNRARASGIDVTLDIYPYTYWLSTLTVLFPERDFRDRKEAEFAMTEVAPADSAYVIAYEPDPSVVNKSIAQIAVMRHSDAATTLMDLIAGILPRKPDGSEYDEGIMAQSMIESDIRELVQWPHANLSSDGELDGAHPRGFGAFARFYRLFVREQQALSMEAAVHRMTGLSAAHMGITDRGRIAEGVAADLVLVDPLTFGDQATPAEPHRTATGVRGVWVNGVLVFDGRRPTGAHPGQVIRRAGTGSR